MRFKIALIIIIVGLFAISSRAQKFELITPELMDLGKLPSDTIIMSNIKFRNSGTNSLKIDRVKSSCGCTVTELEKLEFLPAENGDISVRLNTRGFRGVVRKYVTIYLKEGEPKTTRVVLQADIKPKIEIEPYFVDLQNININDGSIKRALIVRNNSKKTIVAHNGKSNNPRLKIDPKEFTLSPDSSQTVWLNYTPKKVGRDDCFLSFDFSEPPNNSQRIPVFVNVLKN